MFTKTPLQFIIMDIIALPKITTIISKLSSSLGQIAINRLKHVILNLASHLINGTETTLLYYWSYNTWLIGYITNPYLHSFMHVLDVNPSPKSTVIPHVCH